MKYIKVAKTAGFCKGVRSAVEKVLNIAKKSDRKTVTLGPVIHNPQVLEQLANLGVKSIKDPADAKDKNVLIRAHGIPPEIREKLKSTKAFICDATCPDVARVQGMIKKHANKGFSTVIVGDRGHAEVQGLLGFANNNGHIVSSVKDAEKLPDLKNVCVVAQTTQQRDIFEEVCEYLTDRFGNENCLVFNTICPATTDRQDEVREIAQSVDMMIVIGGKSSANTARLAKISKETGTETFYIETERELDGIDISKYEKIGVTAGASTPNWMIKQVVIYIKEKQRDCLPGFVKFFLKGWDLLRNLNLLLAFSAGCLCYALCHMQNISSRKEYFFVSFFYILAIYTVNALQNRSVLKLYGPGKLKFYENNRSFLIGMVVLSVSVILLITFFLGFFPFIASLVLLFLGSVCQFLGIPIYKNGGFYFIRINQLPGSKDFIVIIGWVTMVLLIPLLSSDNVVFSLSSFTTLLFVVTLVAIRSIVNDIRETQEDMMVGSETLPIFMGKKKVLNIIAFMVVMTSFMLILGATLGWIPKSGYLLLVPLWSMYVFSLYNENIQYSLNILFSDIMDIHFIAAGIISYLQHRI